MEDCAEGSGCKSGFFCGSVISAEDCGLSSKNKNFGHEKCVCMPFSMKSMNKHLYHGHGEKDKETFFKHYHGRDEKYKGDSSVVSPDLSPFAEDRERAFDFFSGQGEISSNGGGLRG